MKVDVNDVAAADPDALARNIDALAGQAQLEKAQSTGWVNFVDLADQYQGRLEAPVVRGLVRRGEVMNIVAPPKVGKSWMAYHLALAVLAGTSFILPQWECSPGSVFLIDNELHRSTLSNRLMTLSREKGVGAAMANLEVLPIRGRQVYLEDLHQLVDAQCRLNRPSLIILDAFYRFLRPGTSENDNASVIQMYNELDRLAQNTGAALAVVHHSTKGSQANKSIVDVGSGASAQARAVDTHMVLRQHETDGWYVAEAACRSWAPPDPAVVAWGWPHWDYVADGDPSQLLGRDPRRVPPADLPELDDATFLTYLDSYWKSRSIVEDRIREREGCTVRMVKTRIGRLVERHGLLGLKKSDGMKNCGDFMARISRYGGMEFALRGE